MIELYQSELNRSKIYQTLKTKCEAETDLVNASVIQLVNRVVEYACEKTKVIIKYMPEYTLHDETHLFRVYQIMERLIPKSTLDKLSIPELMLLTLTAFLHDIGMAPFEEHIRAWKKDWKEENPREMELELYNKFERFKSTYPNKIKEIEKFIKNNKPEKAVLIEDYIITEYIRNTHIDRAREIIASDWNNDIKYKDFNLTNEFAQLCFSHGKDALTLLEFETNIQCCEDSYVCLPFIGVILRLADLLDFDAKRTPSVLFSHLSVRNPISLKEWQKHRAVQSWTIKPDKILFTARCSHPAIEKSIKDFCDSIDNELKNCSNVLSRLNDEYRMEEMEVYKIPLPAKVDRSKIQPEKDIRTNEPLYVYKDTCFELSKNQVIDLLMGTSLYDDTKAAMRELIQNSIDACLVAKALSEKLNYLYNPEIVISYYSKDGEDFLEVEDNGIGMNQHIIDKYYSRVGSSYYKSKDFYDLKAQTGLSFKPISRFGIGILSCFMVSDTIEVETRKLLDDGEKDEPFDITIEGYDSIFTIKKGGRKQHGTRTRLILRQKENPWEKMGKTAFIEYVKQSVPNPPVKITIITDKEELTEKIISIDENSFATFSAEKIRDYSWNTSEYIKEIVISLDDKAIGFKGEAIIAVLESSGFPTGIIQGLYRNVEIEGKQYELENKIQLKENEIEKIGTVIEVKVDSGIETRASSSTLVKSKSKFSVHGIDFPNGIFPSYFDVNKKTKLKWPLPMLIVLDITGSNDIDLNSARTEIVFNENWNTFEENLSYLICSRIKEKVNIEYWKKLKGVLLENNKSENFKIGLEKINDN